jgi:type VI secretion system protein ImpB
VAKESIFKKKERVRPPRVHITYEVETGGAMALKELPFVVGVMADLSGHPKEPLLKLKDEQRKFVNIDRDNFDDVLKSSKPRLALKVDNRLKDDGSQLSVELNFGKLDDFSPEGVARQVPPLANLLDVRARLKDLLSRTEGNDRLEEMLDQIITNADVQQKLASAVGAKPPAAGGDTPAGDAPSSEEK